MKISLLQPKINRGDIEGNINKINKLIDKSKGDLLVLPEYVLTGSLILDKEANLNKWVEESKKCKQKIKFADKKILILNSLLNINGAIFNCCELLPTDKKQKKVNPDKTELAKGVKPGEEHILFNLYNKLFKIIICSDFKFRYEIKTDEVDFILFIYHFTKDNYEKRISELKKFVKERNITILVSSIISDKNIGFSTYIDEKRIISLSSNEGILEIEI